MGVYKNILFSVGNTPLVKVQSKLHDKIELYVKVEGANPTGSIKDRAASKVLKYLLDHKQIDRDTTIIESSSGYFGVALANYCHLYGLRFICVVDPKILKINEYLIRAVGGEIVKVDKPDSSGGYLLSRIAKVKELLLEYNNSFWINQYENKINAMAYGEGVGEEICQDVCVDYIFVGVSSGGTITGVSQCVKRHYPNAKVIAVDVKGSVVFGQEPLKRMIPGIGSSIVPQVMQDAIIDEIVIVDECESISMCRELLDEQNLFVGGSAGSVYAAVCKYFKNAECDHKPKVVAIFADRGERYFETIYNDEWCNKYIFGKTESKGTEQ